MSVTKRIGREYAAQLVGIAVVVVDRFLVTAILLRAWGVETFALWSVAIAAAGMIAFFDFGLNLYFSNRLTFSVEQAKTRRAHHAYRAGNLLVLAAAWLGAVVICATFWGFGDRFVEGHFDVALFGTVVALVLGAASKYALSVQYYLYRAHRQFERQTYLNALTDLCRIAAAGLVALCGGGLLAAALAYLAGAILSSLPVVLLDGRRRFPSFRFGFEVPNRAERKVIPPIAFGFWAQSVPLTILTFVPVFVLAAIGAGAAGIAQFVLIRTLANMARMAPQLMATVLGQEVGRLFGRREYETMFVVYREGCKLLAAQSAGMVGVIIALASPIFDAWTKHPQLYNAPMLWLALAPLALGPSLVLANAVFGHTNRPWDMAAGRAVQLLLTVLVFIPLPIEEPALRLMAALAVGEVLGFGIPAYLGIRRLLPAADLRFMLDLCARVILSGALCYAAAAVAYRLLGPSLLSLAAACLIGGGAILVASLLIGIERSRRAILFAAVRRAA